MSRALRIDVTPYDVVLVRPMRASQPGTGRRCGAIVSVIDADGVAGRGEAAPLTDQELARAIRDLDDVADTSKSGNARDDAAASCSDLAVADIAIESVRVAIERALGRTLVASARCALESALLDLAARRARMSVSRLLGGPARTSIEVNALVGDESVADVEQRVRELAARGFRTFKLKVGNLPPAQERLRVRAAALAAGEGSTLRLDANSAWTCDQAAAVLDGLELPAIDYVEDPLGAGDSSGLRELCAVLGRRNAIGVALDEPIVCADDLAAAAEAGCAAVVLKLQRIGGPLAALQIARAAQAHGLRVVLTDSLETAVGRMATLQTAAACTTEAVGLAGAFCLADGEAHAQPRIEIGPEVGA